MKTDIEKEMSEKRMRLNKYLIDHINEKFQSSLDAGGIGLVDIVFIIEDETRRVKVRNIASVF